jgi:hypothetical protein
MDTEGNVKPCGNDVEPFCLVKEPPARAGVLGAVAIPACRCAGLSDVAASVLVGENEEGIRGEGCVEDLGPSGAVSKSAPFLI